jgi:hypothetical protein
LPFIDPAASFLRWIHHEQKLRSTHPYPTAVPDGSLS